MKLLITFAAGSAMLALAGCNQADAQNNLANAAEPLANEAAQPPDANAMSNEAMPPDPVPPGDKPADVGGDQSSQPEGDKPL